jgi:hypothetical protein
MYENNKRIRPHLDDAKFDIKEPQNKKTSVIYFQIVVCILCLIAAIAIKQLGGARYVAARDYAKNAMNNNITSSQISDVISIVRNQFPDAKEVFGTDFASSDSYSGTSSAISSSLGSSSSLPSAAGSSSAESSGTEASSGTVSSSQSSTSEIVTSQTSLTAIIR